MEKYYSIQEIANILKVHQATIRRLIRDRKIDATMVGRVYRISERALKLYLSETK